MTRIDKILSKLGFGSRKEVKKLIRKGLVSINGETVFDDDYKVNEEKDSIFVNGEEIKYQEYVYLMLYKPAGYLSATTDNKDKTVLDLIGKYQSYNLFPFGRLDKDSEGLLILGNDGNLAHKLLSNKHHVLKKYYVEVLGELKDFDILSFEKGIVLNEEKCKPAKLEIITSSQKSSCYVSLTEGKYHQIKRMFAVLGKTVTYLKRVEFHNLKLDEKLKKGEYRLLTKTEIEALKKV